MAQHNIDGHIGEQLAASWLMERGYVILEQNYRYRSKEIDIIACKDEMLVVVEVKLRGRGALESPASAVDLRKIRHLVSATNGYIKSRSLDCEVRFDVIAITYSPPDYEVEHIPDAFFPPLF